jgi:thymidylate synthase (FAD)
MKIDVLDHGFVRLVSYMQPVPMDRTEYIDFDGKNEQKVAVRSADWTGDLEIVRNARTSYNADWRSEPPLSDERSSKDEKLIHYLYSHRHTTPFEAMVFTFEVQAPIFVFRQWHRHRTWSYNEVSARYTELPELFYVPESDQVREQSKLNKQGRGEAYPIEYAEGFRHRLRRDCEQAFKRYRAFLADGVARELARLVLPVNTYSRMFATVDLHNLFHFLELRLDSHAQYEIRVYAEALLKLVEPVVPVAVAAFKSKLS